MSLPTFENPNPITDSEGNIWDLFWMTSLIISTNLENGSPTLYAEFFPCREIIIDVQGNKQKIIKQGCQGYEIKSITVDNLFEVSETDEVVGQVLYMILSKVKEIGQQQGIFKQN
jgi:hypothetical protein